MIYLTGDVHGTIDIHKFRRWGLGLTKKDYVIVLGDFGITWNEDLLAQLTEFYDDRPWTTLFIDGNHENFTTLGEYRLSEWNGSVVQQITPSIIHLLRGRIYSINGNSFWCMGGAYSIDKAWRIPGYSWWPEEEPNDYEQQHGIQTLMGVNNQVDYVLTHAAPSFVAQDMFGFDGNSTTERYLQSISTWVTPKHWYFAHYHFNATKGNYTCLYNDIVPLGGTVERGRH